ncbi:hypothetical protein NQ318_008789 [Aromia moschata]|uniref:Uncharacterized protein n=1 Tax=Aromia moschata TaxID=1265417 RepID=A0AAV8ZA37_9CUCU|nr:hypothetical protein NQ318_008789 [Aromia moschata]
MERTAQQNFCIHIEHFVFQPPDFQKSDDMQFNSASSDSVSKQSFYNLRKKPQQENLNDIPPAISLSQSQASSGVRTIEPRLLKYIKKLLGKSRESIENLTVSSSSVQTPSQSIVEMDTNNPLYQLHNIIKYFNLKTEDIMKELSYSSDHTTLHYNTSASSSERSLQGQEKSTSSKKETSLNSVISKDSISEQYADITDSCSRRIAALAAMISQIREEKIQMLNNGLVGENAGSDRDYSTAYLDLPKSKDSSSGSEGKHSSLNSLDDDELHRRLTEVDMSLARKLRKFSPVRAETIDEDKHAEAEEISKDAVDDMNVDRDIQIRLERLLKETVKPLFHLRALKGLKKITFSSHFFGSTQVSPNASKTSHTSSPRKGLQLLAGTEDETGGTQTSYHSTSSKFNENPPDTVTKVSITSKKSPDRQVDAEKSKSSSADKTISPLNLSYDITSKSIISDKSGSTSTLSAQKSVHFSSSSSDDMQSIEAMLKSIGMEWAISTLHKTQEALALTSSSSSLDVDTKRKAKGNESGGSEVSLRDYLRKQLISKVSSSTMKTDASPASLLSEFSDLSSILVSSKEKQDRKRTSTPLTRSTNKSGSSEKRVIFSGVRKFRR